MIYQQANTAYLMTLYGRATLPSMLTTRDRAHRRINILSRFFAVCEQSESEVLYYNLAKCKKSEILSINEP